MSEWLQRTRALLGDQAMERLASARVAVLGLGGVGGAAAEALCRSGVGHLFLVDHDQVDVTNLNRQLLATIDVVGKNKTEAALARLRAIYPGGDYQGAIRFYLPEDSQFLYEWRPDFVVDAIDTITAKLHLAITCAEKGVPLITCLGTGNRLDPSQLRVGDIVDTAGGCGCGLARVMRRELRRRGMVHCPVLYSLEPPRKVVCGAENGRHTPGSAAFVPSAAGLLLASHVVRTLTNTNHSLKGSNSEFCKTAQF